MANRVYTSTVYLPITYTWKCSKCGKVNVCSQTIETSGKTSAYGRYYQPMSDWATSQAYAGMRSSLRVLFGERGKYAHYRSLKLNERCERCHNKEVWAQKSLFEIPKKPLFLMYWLFVFLWIGPLVYLINNGSRYITLYASLPVLVGLLLLGLFLIDKFYFIKKRETQLDDCPLAAFPVLVIDGKPVAHNNLLSNDDPIPEEPKNTPKEKNTTVERSQTVIEQKSNDPNRAVACKDKEEQVKVKEEKAFCYKCGKPLQSGSRFCSYCGTKIDD